MYSSFLGGLARSKSNSETELTNLVKADHVTVWRLAFDMCSRHKRCFYTFLSGGFSTGQSNAETELRNLGKEANCKSCNSMASGVRYTCVFVIRVVFILFVLWNLGIAPGTRLATVKVKGSIFRA